MNRLNRNAGVLALLALVVAVLGAGLVGASAAGVFITSKQIKNGTILTQDIHRGGVQTSDIANGTVSSTDVKNSTIGTEDIGNNEVGSADIANGQVDGEDLGLTPPEEDVQLNEFSAVVEDSFQHVDTAGSFEKAEAASPLEVQWTGTVAAAKEGLGGGEGASHCIFQLRVDGQPASAQSTGEIISETGKETSAAVPGVLFENLGVGSHSIEVWARAKGGKARCTVNPSGLGIRQVFVVAEQTS